MAGCDNESDNDSSDDMPTLISGCDSRNGHTSSGIDKIFSELALVLKKRDMVIYFDGMDSKKTQVPQSSKL
jgi:hypothetical protein